MGKRCAGNGMRRAVPALQAGISLGARGLGPAAQAITWQAFSPQDGGTRNEEEDGGSRIEDGCIRASDGLSSSLSLGTDQSAGESHPPEVGAFAERPFEMGWDGHAGMRREQAMKKYVVRNAGGVVE